jgi:DNA-binding response OmpR family regulator
MCQTPEIAANAGQRTTIRVGGFAIDLDRETLYGPDGEIRLRPKSFQVLPYLVLNHLFLLRDPS